MNHTTVLSSVYLNINRSSDITAQEECGFLVSCVGKHDKIQYFNWEQAHFFNK